MGEMIRHDPRSPARPTRAVGPAPGRYRPAERPGLPVAWWRGNPRYSVYMLRELSSVFLALWAVLFLAQLKRLRRSQEAYEVFVKGQGRPLWVAFHLTAFAFALLHSVTWLQLAGVV